MSKRPTNQPKPATSTVTAPAVAAPQPSAPVDLIAATPELIAEQVAKIDEAWAVHRSAGLSVVLAQAGVDALPAEASEDERAQALLALDDATMAVLAAEQEIRQLMGLAADALLPVFKPSPVMNGEDDQSQTKASEDDGATDRGDITPDDGVTGDASSASAGVGTGASQSADAGEQPPASSTTHTTPSDDRNGTGNLAGPATGDGNVSIASVDSDFKNITGMLSGDGSLDERLAEVGLQLAAHATAGADDRKPFVFNFDDYIDDLLEGIDFAVDNGDQELAQTMIAGARAAAAEMIENGRKLESAMAARETKLFRSVTVWPLSVVIYDGETRPIGRSFEMDPATAEPLLAAGVLSDGPPEEIVQADAVDLGAL